MPQYNNAIFYYHTPRTAPRSICLGHLRKKVPYKGRTRQSDRVGKTRTTSLETSTALLETRTAILETRTAILETRTAILETRTAL